jgi:acetyl-CoA synthetase
MDPITGRAAYCAVNDILVRHRDDYRAAIANFAHADRNVPLCQRIRRIEFMNLPKTISGKIRRVDLRARENACEADGLTQEYRDR